MKYTLLLSALSFSASIAMASDIKLPAPRTAGGKPVFEAVAARASAPSSAFPTGKISREELSTILWAASGKNRPGKWTVPFGMGLEPYISIYVAGEDGLYRYSWEDHSLRQVSGGDVRAKVSRQSFSASAPYTLIFTSDRTPLKKAGRAQEHWAKWTHVAVGAMTQQVYLAADALGIGARYLQSLDADFIRKATNQPDDEETISILPIGKR
ncbi:MAG: nitroreductase family protein [Candidatus Accumulibacter sp.]|jgi:nitroreductase|nr:nitroreductase family protein [Accumulibacter sp.]